jgi:hypothetical protein
MNGDMLGGKSRYGHQRGGHERGKQEQPTPVDHDETSAICEGTEIRLTELRNIRCKSSVEDFPAANIYVYINNRSMHKSR